MSAKSLSVVVWSDALSGKMNFVDSYDPFEYCREDIRKRKRCIPFTWCIKNVKRLNYYAQRKSPHFRIDSRGKRTFRMTLSLDPQPCDMKIGLFLNTSSVNFGIQNFSVHLSRYAGNATDGEMEDIERVYVTFIDEFESLLLYHIIVETAQVEMDLLVIHIETDDTVATRSSLSTGSSKASASSTPDNNGTLSLLNDMERLLLEAKFTDVALCSEGQDIRAHRCILSGRSPVFDRMFQHPLQESQDGRVDIPDVAFVTLQRLVAYMYSSRLTEPLSYEAAMALFVASDKYDVPDLRDVCVEVLVENLSFQNCVDVSILADSHGNTRLRNAAVAVLAEHHRAIWPDNCERLRARPDVMKVLLDVMAAGHSDDD